MSDSAPTPAQSPADAAPAKRAGGQLFVDLGPVIIFMLTYNFAPVPQDDKVYWATGVFLAATVIALLFAWRVQKRLPPMLIVTAVVVFVFGGLALLLHDRRFIFHKPTIVNVLYAAIILGGLLVRQNVWKMLFQSAFPALPDRVWTTFAIRWGLFFIALAVANEVVVGQIELDPTVPDRVLNPEAEIFWNNYRVFGVIPLTFLFMLANMPLLMKHMPTEDKA